MTDLLPSPWRGLYYSASFAPREVFSVSQVEKAFGSAHEPGRGCLRAWALRYLAGLKEPEYTYEEACALPEDTPELKKFKGGVKKKTFGKVFHLIAEKYYRGEQIDLSEDAANRFFSGSHLAPHPTQCVEIEIEKPIRVRTTPNPDPIARAFDAADPITWSGFKDLVVRLPNSPRYLFDWKTTTPTVDNRKNKESGKPLGSWTWQKDERAIKIDYQANLYAYDEYVNYGSLPRGRWVYFANSGKPDARATDYEPELPLVLETVRVLDEKARILREHIRQFRSVRSPVLEGNVSTVCEHIEPNLSNCMAFGGCPYRSAVGGPCTAEQSGVIPVGSLTSTLTRPQVKPREALPAGAQLLTPGFTFEVERHDHMSLADDIENAKRQRQGAAQAPATTGFAPQGAPPTGPAWGGPAPAPTAPPAPGAPVFDPSFAFGSAPAAPPPAPAAPTLPAPGQNVFGSPYPQNPEFLSNGRGGWFKAAELPAMAQAGDAQAQALFAPPAAAAPPPAAPPPAPAPAEGFPSHVNPPEAANPAVPAEAPRKRGRPAKDKSADAARERSSFRLVQRGIDPAPADFNAPELTVTLKLGSMVVTVPAPPELCEGLQAYVLKTVNG